MIVWMRVCVCVCMCVCTCLGIQRYPHIRPRLPDLVESNLCNFSLPDEVMIILWRSCDALKFPSLLLSRFFSFFSQTSKCISGHSTESRMVGVVDAFLWDGPPFFPGPRFLTFLAICLFPLGVAILTGSPPFFFSPSRFSLGDGLPV